MINQFMIEALMHQIDLEWLRANTEMSKYRFKYELITQVNKQYSLGLSVECMKLIASV